MADYATRKTDKQLKDLERRMRREYQQAAKEVQAKADDYFCRFRIKDETWARWVREGTKTREEYQAWRTGQMIVGERWKRMQESLANEFHDANKRTGSMIHEHVIDTFTEHLNFGTFTVSRQADPSIDAFTLYSRDAVERLLTDDPDMLPPPGKRTSQRIREGKDVLWNKQQIQSVMTQGILQGESIPNLAKRLAEAVGEKNYKAAVRNARTMNTGARNAGREVSFQKAQDMGIDLDVMWMSAMDSHVRISHVHMDGERKSPGGTYSNGLRFPGDPHGEPAEVWNCRCTEIGCVKGVPFDQSMRISDRGEGYEEWKKRMEEEGSTSRDILRQEKIGNAVKQSYINEYRSGGKGFSYSEKSGIINSMEREREFGIKYGKDALKADMEYINSDAYAKKFKSITDNAAVNNKLCELSRKAINDNSGTTYESMYLINGVNGEVIASIDKPDEKHEGYIAYTPEFKENLEEAQKNKTPIIALHNHGEGMPPSADDFMKAYENGYFEGVVVGHNGQVYGYKNDSVGLDVKKCDSIHGIAEQLYYQGYDVDRSYRTIYDEWSLNYIIF